MCSKDVCSQGMVNTDPGNYAASGPIQLPARAGEEDTGGHVLSYDGLRW